MLRCRARLLMLFVFVALVSSDRALASVVLPGNATSNSATLILDFVEIGDAVRLGGLDDSDASLEIFLSEKAPRAPLLPPKLPRHKAVLDFSGSGSTSQSQTSPSVQGGGAGFAVPARTCGLASGHIVDYLPREVRCSSSAVLQDGVFRPPRNGSDLIA